jgi:hypothetical protein
MKYQSTILYMILSIYLHLSFTNSLYFYKMFIFHNLIFICHLFLDILLIFLTFIQMYFYFYHMPLLKDYHSHLLDFPYKIYMLLTLLSILIIYLFIIFKFFILIYLLFIFSNIIFEEPLKWSLKLLSKFYFIIRGIFQIFIHSCKHIHLFAFLNFDFQGNYIHFLYPDYSRSKIDYSF